MDSRTPIRVVIADDHPIFRSGLRRLLEDDPGVAVVGEAGNAAQAVSLTRALVPDVLLLDLAMPGPGGLDVLRDLTAAGLPTRTVLLTAEIGSTDIVAALRLGAVGVLLKSTATELLFKCLRSVMEGRYWVERDTVGTLAGSLMIASGDDAANRKSSFGLTVRELEIARLVADGCSNKDVATSLRIAEDTVKHHLSRVFDKTGTSSRLELALFVRHHGLADGGSRRR